MVKIDFFETQGSSKRRAFERLFTNFLQFNIGFFFALKKKTGNSEKVLKMTELDLYFPYIVLLYGTIMTVVTNLPNLRERASETMNTELLHWFYGHKMIGNACLFVGGLWSIQRVFI